MVTEDETLVVRREGERADLSVDEIRAVEIQSDFRSSIEVDELRFHAQHAAPDATSDITSGGRPDVQRKASPLSARRSAAKTRMRSSAAVCGPRSKIGFQSRNRPW